MEIRHDSRSNDSDSGRKSISKGSSSAIDRTREKVGYSQHPLTDDKITVIKKPSATKLRTKLQKKVKNQRSVTEVKRPTYLNCMRTVKTKDT